MPKISRLKHFSHTLCPWGIVSNTYGHATKWSIRPRTGRAMARRLPKRQIKDEPLLH